MRVHRVSARLYRSDQPSLDDLEALRAMGVDTVINLRREEGAVWRRERDRAHALGMRFVHFPFYGIFGAKRAFLDSILTELARAENGTLLVHCKNGRDRTSLVVGLYRVLHDGVSPEASWRDDFVAFGHDPDRPTPPWDGRVTNWFFGNVRRAFVAHLRAHGVAVGEGFTRG